MCVAAAPLAVWAPTAQKLELLHFKDARGGEPAVVAMQEGVMGPGVWSVTLPGDAMFTYYKYRCVWLHSCVACVRMHVCDGACMCVCVCVCVCV